MLLDGEPEVLRLVAVLLTICEVRIYPVSLPVTAY